LAARQSIASAPQLSAGIADHRKALLHHHAAADDKKTGKALHKPAGVRRKTLIPSGDEEKGNFKDF
jgi:hypothetical protein